MDDALAREAIVEDALRQMHSCVLRDLVVATGQEVSELEDYAPFFLEELDVEKGQCSGWGAVVPGSLLLVHQYVEEVYHHMEIRLELGLNMMVFAGSRSLAMAIRENASQVLGFLQEWH